MKHFRITKYNPANRCENGVYRYASDEWSEACDIGHVFNGKIFTAQDYFAVEEEYIKTILSFFDASGLKHLRMTITEPAGLKHDEWFQEWKRDFPQLYNPEFEQIPLVDDRKIYRDELAILIKMNLRQFVYCQLSVLGKFYLHFGDDSYVYIATNVQPENIDPTIGMYIEEMKEAGPYMARGKIEVLIDKGEIGQEFVTESDMKFLAHVPRLKIRDLLGYSQEHPFVTHMPITPEIARKLETLTEYKFDLDHFEYMMSTYGDEY